MKITDIAALVLAVATIAQLLARPARDPQVEGLCASCEKNGKQPCCAPKSWRPGNG